MRSVVTGRSQSYFTKNGRGNCLSYSERHAIRCVSVFLFASYF
nr:MAG TPA: hypothetical protein [Caudoviricetes sp.]